jgi:hypothetical protein
MHLSVTPIVFLSLFTTSVARADGFSGVPSANPKAPGITAPNGLTPELVEAPVAQGSNPLENQKSVTFPNGGTAVFSDYGYYGDGTHVPLPGTTTEATKSEPDKNTYLVLRGQKGADPSYDYGTHFLFQGHEAGSNTAPGRRASYITRVNLDADPAHRVTLFAWQDKDGNPIPQIDGSTWDPFANRLLFTAELGNAGGVFSGSLDFPSEVEEQPALGRGGYEGIQNDSDGNLWIAEDAGGATVGLVNGVDNRSRQPNSFLFRFVPGHASDLAHGKLQVLQVLSLRTGDPIVFHPGLTGAALFADITSDDQKDLHTYGKSLPTRWITVHDTEKDGTAPFDANALAKSKGGTPFRRPENGQFRPGTHFTEFFFDETGDTDIRTQAAAFGGFGSIFKVAQSSPSADHGHISLFYLGDSVHTAFDNVAFWDRNRVVFVEDAGDTLHSQRNALDSAWMFDARADYSKPANKPLRLIAEGRDASATIDSALLGTAGFQNDGDNEITGIHVSDGDPDRNGILGAKVPQPFHEGWRVFWTQQHGDNVTWEILPAPDGRRHDDD